MAVLVLGLVLFLGIHSVRIFAPAWREQKLRQWGENRWKGLYSIVSLAGFILLVWGYALAWPAAADLYEPPVWMKHVTALLMLFALVLLMVSQLPAGRIKAMVGHPMLLAVKIWAFAHLLANGDTASLLLFGTFLVWAVLDLISVRRRERAGTAEPAKPGPVRNDAIAIVVGLVLYGVLVGGLHVWLFGASPIAVA